MDIGKLVDSKNKILNIIIIAIALFIGYSIYTNEAKKIVELKQKKDLELKKNQLLKSVISLEDKFNSYKKFINNKDISSIMNRLFTIAGESKVKINSLRPAGSMDFSTYVKFPFTLIATASSFKKIGYFISELENSRDIYIIDSLTISLNSTEADLSNSNADNLTLNLTVSTVILK